VRVVRRLRAQLGDAFPVIGVGGISGPETARTTFEAGANLVQLYTGLIYEGPALVRSLIRDASGRR
jgi:dihydroorotate dehydrogenase